MATAQYPAPTTSRRLPYGLTLAVFLVQVALGIVLFAIFQEFVPNTLGASDAWPGFLLTAYGATRFVMETPTGALLDRIERRTGLFVGLAIMMPALLLMNAARNEALYLVFSSMLGLGTAFIWPTTYAISADLYPPSRRGQAAGLLNVGQLLGFGLGALFGALLVEHEPGWLLTIGLVSLVLAAVAAWQLVPAYANPSRTHTTGEARPPLRNALSLDLALIASVILLVTVAVGMIIPAIRPFGEDELGISFRDLTLALGPAIAAGAATYIPAGHLADRMGRGLPLVVSQLMLIACMLIMATTHTVAIAAVGAALGFAGYAIAVPAWNALVMDLASETYRGTIIGFTVALTGCGLAVGPLAGGIIVAGSGAPAVFLSAAGVLVAVCFLLGAYAWHTSGRDAGVRPETA